MATRVPRFATDNLALIAGILLPLLLIGLFFVAGRVTTSSVDPPRHSAIIAASYNERWPNQPWRITVDAGRLTILHEPGDDVAPTTFIKPQLLIWNHTTRSATTLDIDFDNIVEGRVANPELERVNRRSIHAGAQSPDGYTLEYRSGPGAGFLGEIIGFGRYRYEYVLQKNGRTFAVTGSEPLYELHVIGWLLE